MSNAIKGGRKPISQKPVFAAPLNSDDVFTNKLSIPDDIKADAKAKGWELRWLDSKEVFNNGGQHKRDWIPYRRDTSKVPNDLQGFKIGNDPEGIVRRNDLILGFKPKEQAEKHRAFLRQQADRMSRKPQEKAAELRADARRQNLDVKFTEGYDGEEDAGE